MNPYTKTIPNSTCFVSLDEMMSWDDIEEIVTTSHQQLSQTEDFDAKLALWKPKVLSALIENTYLNPLHKLATLAESLTSLNSLYSQHPSDEIHFEIKEIMSIRGGGGHDI